MIVVTVIWRVGVGGRETYYSVCREGSVRRVKTKMRRKKEKKKKKKKKKKRRGEGTGRTVEVMNNESVDKICHDPKNKWLKLYKR